MRAARSIATLAALAFWGCSSGVESLPERPHVVIYLVDTLRADRLGTYGYNRSTSPNIDALGEAGVVFEQASAPAPWTLPSVTSMFLSQLSCEHGVTVDRDRIADGTKPLAVLMKELGYETASFHANPYAGKMTGLDRGFDVSRLVKQEALEEAVGEWLESRQGKPFFLYVHTIEPHNPELAKDRFIEPRGSVPEEAKREVERRYRDYRQLTRVDYDAGRRPGTTDNTEEQRRALNRLDELRDTIDRLYDATVREADARLGRFVTSLQDAGVWQDTLFVFVSDHGEELGDRGGWQHDQSLYQELVHVPLVVRFPRDWNSGGRVREHVGIIDLFPTILDVLGVDSPSNVRGRSFLPLLDGPSDPIEPRVSAMRDNEKKYYRPYKEARGDVNVMMRRGPWKGIWNAELDDVELYRLDEDPRERADLASTEKRVSEAMRTFALAALARCRENASQPSRKPAPELDDATRRQLEALGYVDGEKSP